MNTTAIVVGTDGSAPSQAAVRWAAREAVRRHLPLRVLHAFEWNWQGARYTIGSEFIDVAKRTAEAVMAAAVGQARAAAPTVTTQVEPVMGNPVPQLLQAAQDAALLVLGNRGRGGFASLLLGSVSQQVATHAACPVVVVRGSGEVIDGPVVVGVDDSPSADEVLATAFDAAAARDCSLVAVRSYLATMPLWIGDVPTDAYPLPEDDAEQHRQLQAQIAAWQSKYPLVETEIIVSPESAAAVLSGLSGTARLVVVGSRGHGGLAGTLLGSTGLQLLHHADCPVLIVRPRPTP